MRRYYVLSYERSAVKQRAGWTVVLTMFIILFLLILGTAMITMFRNEAQQANNYVEASIAHYIAEAGVEHAIYELQRNANDFINDPQNMGWNKKFANLKLGEEVTFDIPFVDNRDRGSVTAELARPVDAEIASKVQYGSLLSLSVSCKLSEELDEYRKIARLRILAKGKYKNISRCVEVEKEVYLFKDIPIQFDHVLYVNNQTLEKFPGRRDKGNSGFWRKFANFFNGRYVPQHLFVNGKTFLRNFEVPLNKEADPTWAGAFETKPSMIDKLSNKKVDANVGPPLSLNRSAVSTFTLGLLSPIKEIDEGLLDGGSRGNTDLTGFDPLNWLEGFFKSIGSKINKDTKPNQLFGKITRVYKYQNGRVEEPYVTATNTWYNGPVEEKPDLAVKYPADKIIGVLEPALYNRVSYKHRTDFTPVTYKIGNKEVTQNVVKYRGWGPYNEAPPSTGLFGTIKDMFKIKTGKQTALAFPSYAIQLKGYEFVDGDVHIEGYYQGRGTIVATGNIYIGNELLRHPNDKTNTPYTYVYQDGPAQGSKHDGAYNGLQLIALGTKPSATGDPTGRVIFRSVKDPSFAEDSVLKSIFSNKDSKMEIDAFIYAKNGIKSEFGDDSWFGNDQNKMYTTIKGNLVAEKLGITDDNKMLPDDFSLIEDPVWIMIYEELLKSKDQIVVAITPKIINYRQGVNLK